MKKPALIAISAVMALSSVYMTAYADQDNTELDPEPDSGMWVCEVPEVPVIYVDDPAQADSSSAAEPERDIDTFAGRIERDFPGVFEPEKMTFVSAVSKDGENCDITITPDTDLRHLDLKPGYYVFTWALSGEDGGICRFAGNVAGNGELDFIGKICETFGEFFKDVQLIKTPKYKSVVRNGDATDNVKEIKGGFDQITDLASLGLPDNNYRFGWDLYEGEIKNDENDIYLSTIYIDVVVENGDVIISGEAYKELDPTLTARDQNKDNEPGGGSQITFDSSSDTGSSSGTDSKNDTESTSGSSSDTDSRKDTESTPDSSSDTDSKKDTESTPDSSSDTDSKKDAESTPDSSSESGAYVSLGGDGGVYSFKSDKTGKADSTSGGTGFTAPNVALKAEKTTSGDNKTTTTTTTTATTTDGGSTTTTTTADNNASDTAANGDTANSETGRMTGPVYLLAALSAAAVVAVKKHPKAEKED